jgi:ribonuclease VapC
LIVVDSSALVAILLNEPEQSGLLRVLATERACISAMNVFETQTVILRHSGQDRVVEVRNLLAANDIEVVAFDDAQADAANAAYARFGKGFHPARLNLCDCAAYALAKSLDAPLLYKGEDFARTDIVSASTAG